MALRPYLIEEITLDCADGVLTLREAFRQLGLLGVTGAAASALLAAVPESIAASGASTAPPTTDGAGATTPIEEREEITFPGPAGDLIGVFSGADPAHRTAIATGNMLTVRSYHVIRIS